MKKILSFSFIYFFILLSTSFAQLNRANKYYESYDYYKAIELYKKVLKKEENKEALEKIANSYRIVKKYPQAEAYYARLVKKDSINPINYFYYGIVLKNNNKIEEAKEQFKIYSRSVPDDKHGEAQFKFIEDIKIWISRAQQYEIKQIPAINTSHEEFSPVIFKNQIAYASSKKKDLVNESSDEWDGQPFLHVVANPLKTDKEGKTVISKNTISFPYPINTDYHDGPICFNAEQTTAYLTRVGDDTKKKSKKFVNRPKLYIYELKGGKWTKKDPFPYNSDSYSVVHPSLSNDGQYLYFASDMPGGHGGMDIYVCKKEGESWSQPQNLGENINSLGNEVFPFIRKDGHLFFSSDTHPGFGGLDVFSSKNKGDQFSEVENMGSPFNSTADDFGILFTDDMNGYLSSDRSGGRGSDDIYGFTLLSKFIAVTGKILLSQDINDPARNIQVNLLTADGNIVRFTTTDTSGFFKFENLDPEKNYMVKLNEDDPNLKKNKEYYMADQTGKIIRVTVINDKGGKFVFTNLPSDPNGISELGLNDVSFSGNIRYGENPPLPMANTKIDLLNEKGEVVQTVTTNETGAFVFTNLPPDQNFIVRANESDTKLPPDTKVVITNNKGKEIKTVVTSKNGEFKFEFLASDVKTLELLNAEDNDLRFDFKAFLVNEKKAPVANTIINLVNENGDVLRSIKTDLNGGLIFTDLDANKNLLFTINEKDSTLKEFSKLFLVDASGKILKEIGRSKGVFRFVVLPSEESTLGTVYSEDPQLTMGKKGNIQPGRLEWKAFLVDADKRAITSTMINLMNEKKEITQSIKTDEKGSFYFTNLPSDKNLVFGIDENDPKMNDLKIIYIVNEKGEILKEIVKSGGKFIFTVLPGEDKKLGLVTTEDTELTMRKKDDPQQVRFEWKAFLVDENKKRLAETKINLLNEKNEILQSALTNENGGFMFTDLPSDKSLLFGIDENDPKLNGVKLIYIVNENGDILKEIVKSGGKFIFTVLPNEETKLGLVSTEDTELKRNEIATAKEQVRMEWQAFLVDENKKPIMRTGIDLVDINNETIQSFKTDDKGGFSFTDLPADKNLLFRINENDPNIKGAKTIYVVDGTGKILKEVVKTEGKFVFTVLPGDEKKLGMVYSEDPWLAVSKLKKNNVSGVITNVENLYYEYGKADLLPEAKRIIDKVVLIMKEDPLLTVVLESHTDCRSSYGFNIKLSRLRAKTVVDYMVTSGIPKEKIKGKGFGESKLKNKCSDDVECAEAEHAKNRRTEFIISRKQK